MWQDAKLLNATANVLFSIVLLAMLVSGVWWLIHRPVFALQVVRVESEKAGVKQNELRHVNTLTIRDQAVPKITGNFFTVLV